MIGEFKYLGFENYEAKALEILLKGKFSVKELSQKANIPFGKIYSVLKKLKEKGILVAPVGSRHLQSLIAIQRIQDDFIIQEKLPGFVFVPFVE